MQLFYFDIATPDQKLLELEKAETRHITKVLRKKVGDQFYVTDGRGSLFDAQISSLSSNRCEISLAFAKAETKPSPQLHIAIAPTKMNDRMEWFIEKATEMGVSSITPIICDRSERRKVNLDRFQRIALSAMQQSAQLWLPEIKKAQTFHEFVSQAKGEMKCIAHCLPENRVDYGNFIQKDKDMTLLIGPEGDFTANEIDTALSAGFTAVTLGERRLRTETAGVYAVATFQALQKL